MPEGPEVRIMSDFVNRNSSGFEFISMYDVAKGNNENLSDLISNFSISSDFYGKQMCVTLSNDKNVVKFLVFMGMNGNWSIVDTDSWSQTKYCRLRFERSDGKSLILHGGYMGPKYKIGDFDPKRGPDIVKDFDLFESNILASLHKSEFNRPICELMLDQRYFNGVGNYLRSTILHYCGGNPFIESRLFISNNVDFFNQCRICLEKAYSLKGGQLRDWVNPFGGSPNEFLEWVFYRRGASCVDGSGRTFWFDARWCDLCPYPTKLISI